MEENEKSIDRQFKKREAFKWSVETSVYVKRNERNCGIGRELYTALEAEHFLGCQTAFGTEFLLSTLTDVTIRDTNSTDRLRARLS